MCKLVQEYYTKLQAFWRLGREISVYEQVTITICDKKMEVNVEGAIPRFSRLVYVD